jgi:outer membrane protein insertion porin family
MISNRLRVALFFLAGLGLGCPVAGGAEAQTEAPPAAQLEGRQVSAVRIVDQTGRVLDENVSGLPLRANQPFTAEAERESLRQLYRTGRYAEIVTQVTNRPEGLQVDFVVKLNFFINAVRVNGLHEPPSDSVAVSSMRLGLGESFRESDMPAALDRLKNTLEDEGLYQAKITYRLVPHLQTQQMDIIVDVVPGQRASVGAINLINQSSFSDDEIRDHLRLKPKTKVTSEALERSVQGSRKWLIARGYLGARVSVVRGAYEPDTNRVAIQASVLAQLKVRVQVLGVKVSEGTLRTLLPIYEEGAVDEDLLQEGRRNLRDYLERQGYFDAQVDYTTSEDPVEGQQGSTEVISYRVELGSHRRLVGLAFAGNHYFPDDLLRSRVRIQPAAFASPGRFSSAQLASDVGSITELYQSNGFRDVHVSSELMNNYKGHSGDLFVTFRIEEGLQTRIAQLTLQGNRALNNDELSAVIGSTAGQPYSDLNVAGDRDNVLALYYDQGFPNAQFHATVENLPAQPGEGPRVNLTYQIEEGPQIRVAQILVGGYEHTHASVIVREIQLHAGGPLSESAVVETQRRLYNLGIFSRVAIAPQNPQGSDRSKTIDILVDEARRYTIGYGLGLEAQRLGTASNGPVAQPLSFSPRVTAEFTKLNLTGRADSLSLKARASLLQGRALLTYSSSNHFLLPTLSFQLTGTYLKARDVQTFTSTREEGSAQLTDRRSLITTLLYRYVYRRVQATDLQIAPEQIPLFNQPTQVSFFSFTWVRDRRDNAADPARGSFNTFDIDVAEKAIGSVASFVRATYQNSTYTRLSPRLVFARSTRIGLEEPFAGSTGSLAPLLAISASDIPLPERFFAGGGTTLRGFGLNQAGPRDPVTGFPVGGLGMLIFNQQLQFPMRLPLIGTRASGGFFYDAGNVFSTFSRITLQPAPPRPTLDSTQTACVTNCTNELNYFSHTVGFEIRYHTPVGPVSIDLGYQLNPARFVIPVDSAVPNGPVTISRLPAFQFFVNLGSTF